MYFAQGIHLDTHANTNCFKGPGQQNIYIFQEIMCALVSSVSFS